jgi:CheY-like chemotaxis protein
VIAGTEGVHRGAVSPDGKWLAFLAAHGSDELHEDLKKVRENPRTKDLPVLLATASSISLASVPRASGFLRKPYSRGVLFAMLKQLLEHRPAKT